jgi:hypothetical protein
VFGGKRKEVIGGRTRAKKGNLEMSKGADVVDA